MTLFVAQIHFDYEGFDVIGIYSEREAAEDACKHYARNLPKFKTIPDKYTVEEYELTEPA